MPTIKASLNPTEARVIGALIEKAITTPDQYPLSLNALVNACNQKSNRDPVLNLDEQTVQSTLDALKKRFLVSEASGYGSRVTKYQHRFCNSAFGGLQLSPVELAILCELLLRGPQTPGELRSHGERLHAFSGIDEVESSLTRLAEREEPLVEKLPREPGKREARYRHLFTATTEEAVSPVHAMPPPQLKTEADRLNLLEQEVKALRAEIARLKQRLNGRTD
jgi:uncharacterized protein YceH (UPF0502 family)